MTTDINTQESDSIESDALNKSKKKNTGVRNTVVVLGAIVAVIFGLQFWQMSKPQTIDREQMKSINAMIFQSPRALTKFQLTDHLGDNFAHTQFAGEWSLVNFGYTHCPDICPTNMLNLSKLSTRLTDQNQTVPKVFMVTVDPERDTVEVLKEYIPYFNDNFVGLTGHPAVVADVARQMNNLFAKAPPANSNQPENYFVDHSDNIAILNPEGQFVGFFRPPHNISNMATAISTLMAAR